MVGLRSELDRMVHQLVRYVSVLPSCIGTVGVDNGLGGRGQHNGLANYVALHRGVLLAGLVMPQAWEISMSKSETTHSSPAICPRCGAPSNHCVCGRPACQHMTWKQTPYGKECADCGMPERVYVNLQPPGGFSDIHPAPHHVDAAHDYSDIAKRMKELGLDKDITAGAEDQHER